MKNIYKLPLIAVTLFLFSFVSVQNIDTASLQRNKNGENNVCTYNGEC